MSDYDAVVVGAGPNGLAAAIELARAGRSVLVREGAETIGGGVRSAELTLPGFTHDVCSAIHPLGCGLALLPHAPARGARARVDPAASSRSPILSTAAPQPCCTARSPRPRPGSRRTKGATRPSSDRSYETGALLERRCSGRSCGPAPSAGDGALWALGAAAGRSASPGGASTAAARAGAVRGAGRALDPAARDARQRARSGSSSAPLGHAVGWPLPRGGSQGIADALASYLRSLGGEIQTGAPVESLAELLGAHRPLRRHAAPVRPARGRASADALPEGGWSGSATGPASSSSTGRSTGPIPWRRPRARRPAPSTSAAPSRRSRPPSARRPTASTSERPFVLLTQPSLFDDTRAPEGSHTAWAYCHVPNGSTTELTETIERQVERFAPGFRDLILARSAAGPAELEAPQPEPASVGTSEAAPTCFGSSWLARCSAPFPTEPR